jgi:hypothetical protein
MTASLCQHGSRMLNKSAFHVFLVGRDAKLFPGMVIFILRLGLEVSQQKKPLKTMWMLVSDMYVTCICTCNKFFHDSCEWEGRLTVQLWTSWFQHSCLLLMKLIYEIQDIINNKIIIFIQKRRIPEQVNSKRYCVAKFLGLLNIFYIGKASISFLS